jgi:exopolysaccharide production protein ExoY
MCGTTVPGAARSGLSAGLKRSADILIGIPLCIVAMPVVALLGLALAVQLRATPIFVHERIGRGGARIPIPKLRTLPTHTPPYADKTVHQLAPGSGLARFLRRSHLDELPQLFLVLLGRLSLVGPRPRMVTEALEFSDPRYDAVRTSVDQGCTGLWQISVDGCRRVSDAPQYDFFYAHHRTLRLDLWILWRTLVQAVGATPITLADVPRWTLHPESPRPTEAACHLTVVSPALQSIDA